MMRLRLLQEFTIYIYIYICPLKLYDRDKVMCTHTHTQCDVVSEEFVWQLSIHNEQSQKTGARRVLLKQSDISCTAEPKWRRTLKTIRINIAKFSTPMLCSILN